MSAVLPRAENQTGQAVCPICRQSVEGEVWTVPNSGRRVCQCDACDFTFIWPRVEQDFSNLPEEAYYGNWQQLDFSGVNFLVADVLAAQRRKLMISRGGPPERPAVLDVGCGAGHVLVHFRAQGWNVRGIDPWSAVTAIGRKYYRLPIETTRLESAAVPPGSQDVVLSLDVLQFVADPREFLAACLSALKPGGLLYVTVPNFGSAESGREGWNWQHFLPMSYLNHFTAASVQRLLETVGFGRVKPTLFGGPEEDGFLRVVAYRPVQARVSWEDVSDAVDDQDLPPLDRRSVNEASLTGEQRAWRENGYLVSPGLIPDRLIDRYCEVRRLVSHEVGYASSTPYMDVPEIRDLCLYEPLADLLEHLLGEPMGLHLNLTGWVSTERDWHQDDYLNPPQVNGHYAGVWIALDRISPDSGPFEFVPGSHRWPIIRQAKVLRLLGYENGDDPYWPWESERLLTPFFEQEIERQRLQPQRFVADKGDVLIWHSRLVHRGSRPERPGVERRSIISHFSAVRFRTDMPIVRRHPHGGLFFVLGEVPNDQTSTRVGAVVTKLRSLFS
jgi:2-polyprenyl-3-methyl-5-hydroxy-6-metoxy-1,4-benzoquinol methylase